MSVVNDIRDGVEEVAVGAARIAGRVALTGVIAVAAANSFVSTAHGQGATPQPIAVTRTAPNVVVPQEICHMAAQSLNGYVRANIHRITDPADRAQLGILNQWISAGCQGTVRLQRTDQAIAAAGLIQTTVGRRFSFDNVITFG